MCIYSLILHHPLGWTRSGAWKQERGWFWFSGSGGVFEFPVMSTCQASICPGTMVLVLMSSFTLLGGGGMTTLNKRNESPLWNTGLQYWSGKWVKQRRPGTKHSAYAPIFSLRKHWRSRECLGQKLAFICILQFAMYLNMCRQMASGFCCCCGLG